MGSRFLKPLPAVIWALALAVVIGAIALVSKPLFPAFDVANYAIIFFAYLAVCLVIEYSIQSKPVPKLKISDTPYGCLNARISCPECGAEIMQRSAWEMAGMAFLVAIFLVGIAFSLAAISILAIFFIDILALAPSLLPSDCLHCKAKIKRKIFSPTELVYNSFVLGLLPFFLLVNSIKPVVHEFAITAFLAILWAAGIAYGFILKSRKKVST